MQVRSFLVALAMGPALASLASPAAAQPSEASTTTASGSSPWRIFAGVGVGRVYDDEGSLGGGPELTVGVGRRLTQTWSIEGVLSHHAHERGDAFRVDGDATAVVGRVLAHVGDEQGPARVFIAAGGGVVRHTGTVAFTSGPQVAPASYEATGGLLALGFGVDIGAGRRWFIRPELQVRIARLERPSFGPEPPYATGLASVTIGWRP